MGQTLAEYVIEDILRIYAASNFLTTFLDGLLKDNNVCASRAFFFTYLIGALFLIINQPLVRGKHDCRLSARFISNSTIISQLPLV